MARVIIRTLLLFPGTSTVHAALACLGSHRWHTCCLMFFSVKRPLLCQNDLGWRGGRLENVQVRIEGWITQHTENDPGAIGSERPPS